MSIQDREMVAFWGRVVYYSTWGWVAYESFRLLAGG